MNNKTMSPRAAQARQEKQSAPKFLIDDPERGWTLFPLQRGLSAYHGNLVLPEYAGLTLRVAFAHIEHPTDRPKMLVRLEVSVWQLDREGRVDQDVLMRQIIENIDPKEESIDFRLLTSAPVTDDDIAEIKRCLGIS